MLLNIYRVIAAPTNAPTTTVIKPMITDGVKPNEWAPAAAFRLPVTLETTEATAAVATVYSDPANDVTCPPAEPARVIASPPMLVTTVAA